MDLGFPVDQGLLKGEGVILGPGSLWGVNIRPEFLAGPLGFSLPPGATCRSSGSVGLVGLVLQGPSALYVFTHFKSSS